MSTTSLPKSVLRISVSHKEEEKKEQHDDDATSPSDQLDCRYKSRSDRFSLNSSDAASPRSPHSMLWSPRSFNSSASSDGHLISPHRRRPSALLVASESESSKKSPSTSKWVELAETTVWSQKLAHITGARIAVLQTQQTTQLNLLQVVSKALQMLFASSLEAENLYHFALNSMTPQFCEQTVLPYLHEHHAEHKTDSNLQAVQYLLQNRRELISSNTIVLKMLQHSVQTLSPVRGNRLCDIGYIILNSNGTMEQVDPLEQAHLPYYVLLYKNAQDDWENAGTIESEARKLPRLAYTKDKIPAYLC